MTMAERIKECRLSNGMTQGELADKLGLQKSAIAKYENGRVKNIKRSTIKKMAEIFDCTPSYLMGFEDNLTQENADLMADLLYDTDVDFLECIDKIKKMSQEQRQRVYGYVDSLIEKRD